jgi:hypothetical protein
MPLPARSSLPLADGQEPDRTSGAPSLSPLKTHPPNTTVQGNADVPLDAAKSRSASNSVTMDFLAMSLVSGRGEFESVCVKSYWSVVEDDTRVIRG